MINDPFAQMNDPYLGQSILNNRHIQQGFPSNPPMGGDLGGGLPMPPQLPQVPAPLPLSLPEPVSPYDIPQDRVQEYQGFFTNHPNEDVEVRILMDNVYAEIGKECGLFTGDMGKDAATWQWHADAVMGKLDDKTGEPVQDPLALHPDGVEEYTVRMVEELAKFNAHRRKTYAK